MNILFLTSLLTDDLYEYNSGDMIIGKGVKQLILKSNVYNEPNFIDVSRFVETSYRDVIRKHHIKAIVYAGMPQYSKFPLADKERWIMKDIHQEIARYRLEYLLLGGGSGWGAHELLTDPTNIQIAQQVNSIAKVITTRDPQSYDFLRTAVGKGNVAYQICPSILASDYMFPDLEHKDNYLIYTPGTYDNYSLELYKRLLQAYNVILVEHSKTRADKLSRFLNAEVKALQHAEDFEVYHQAHTVVSHRLHAVLYAWGAGVPKILHQAIDKRYSALEKVEIKSVPDFKYQCRSDLLLSDSLYAFRSEIKRNLIDDFIHRYKKSLELKDKTS